MAAIWYCLEFISLPKKAIMKYVTESSIDTALEKMESFGDPEIESIFDDFSAKQPAILAFILSNEEAMTEDEFNILLELSLIMYMAFYAESAELREVSETELETIIDIAVKKYEELDEEDDDAMNEAVENAVETANQPLLFQFLIEDLMARGAEGGFVDDASGPAFILPTLQMVLDMFNTGLNGPKLKVV